MDICYAGEPAALAPVMLKFSRRVRFLRREFGLRDFDLNRVDQISGFELIPTAQHGKKVFRALRILLQLLPQTCNMDVHGACERTFLVSPNFLQ